MSKHYNIIIHKNRFIEEKKRKINFKFENIQFFKHSKIEPKMGDPKNWLSSPKIITLGGFKTDKIIKIKII